MLEVPTNIVLPTVPESPVSTTNLFPPSEGCLNVARIGVTRFSARTEQMARVARVIARDRNAGDYDTACLVVAAHQTGALTEIDPIFATIHAAEVADVTGVPLPPVGRRAKKVVEDPLVSEVMQQARLKAFEQQQSIVRPEDVLEILTQTQSIGAVALERLRMVAEDRTTTPTVSDELLDAMLQSRGPVIRSIIERI